MANYCTTTYLKSFNAHRIYNTSSKPTLAQVASHIPTVSGEIDCRLSAVGITVPITTSPTNSAYLFIKRLCALKCACIAENSTYLGGNKNESPHADYYCQEFEKMMEKIEDNPKIINSILVGGNGAVFDSYEYSNVDKRREDTDEPFIRSEVIW